MIIDLNADLGEGIGNDHRLMPYLSSCNIACGEHAGDMETISKTVELALDNKVKIGAHPSFPDRENFGREEMELPSADLKETVYNQIIKIKSTVDEAGGKLHHVKPHGALYNMAITREDIAAVIIDAILEVKASLYLYTPFGSIISTLAKKSNIPVKFEVFADRNYNDDLTLISRKEANAILHDPKKIAAHVIHMIINHKVETIGGNQVHILADTVCVHGDNPNAIEIVKTLRSQLISAGIHVE